MDDVGQGSDKPRRRRRRSSQGGTAEDGEATAPAADAEPVTAPRRGRKASKRREAGAAKGGTAETAEAKPARPRARRRARSAVDAGDGALQGAEGQDGAEDFTGLLLSDLVEGAPAPAARPPRGEAAAGRRRRRGSAEAAQLAPDLEPPASSDEEVGTAADGQRLLEAVSRLDAAGARQGDRAAAARRGPEARPESEFHTGAAGEEVTMEDLLAPLQEGAAFGDVRRQLEGLAKTEPVAEPAAEPKRLRGDRSAEYTRSAQDAAKWRGQVERMRTAEQVELGEAPRLGGSMAGLAQHAEPRDDFERELEELTRAAGAAEEDLQSAKALPVNTRQRDEQQRRQVAQLKALLFREQQASKRLKKIKSKTYHRIQRRAEAREREALLERLDAENPELAKTLRQEYEKKHAEKRMLRHRNARRKWAQTMQRFAKGDKAAQREVSKRAQDAHDEERGLKRAIKGQDPDRSDDSDAADLSASDSEGAAPGRRSVAKQTLDRAKKLTAGELKGLEEGGELPTTGLLGMNFMRNAIQQRREEAKREAKDVLEELQGLDQRLDAADGDSEEEKEAGGGEEREAGGPGKPSKRAPPKQFTAEELAAARQQVDKMLDEEDGGFDCSVSGPLTVRGVSSTALPPAAAASAPEGAPEPARPAKPARTPKSAGSAKRGGSAAPAPENPWLQVGPGGAGAGAERAAGAGGGPAPAAAAEEAAGAPGGAGGVGAAAEKKGRKKRKRAAAEEEEEAGGEEAEGEGAEGAALAGDVLSVLNADTEAAQEQRDLVRTAFVEGAQEEDFEEEQDELQRKREERDQPPEELAGWGHWTGEGAPARKPRRQKAEPKAPEPEEAKKPHVQIYEGGPGDKAAKYFVNSLPSGMTSAQQYNAHMRMPLGPEWTGLQTHLQRVKPKTFVKVGNIVPPLQFVKHLPPQQRDTALKTWSASRQPKRLKARI